MRVAAVGRWYTYYVSDVWHCATDQAISSTQCATFLLNVAVFRRVPRSGLSSLQKQFRKTYYDCLRRICDVFMPLLCALFGATVVFMVMFRFQGGSTLASMTKLVS